MAERHLKDASVASALDMSRPIQDWSAGRMARCCVARVRRARRWPTGDGRWPRLAHGRQPAVPPQRAKAGLPVRSL